MPLAGVVLFVLDGVFIGSNGTGAMLITMGGALGNHGLWLAFTLIFLARAAGQAWIAPRLTRQAFGP